MALSISLDQLAVHQCSKAVVQYQTSQYSWQKKSDWKPPEFTAAATKDEEPAIPSPEIFESLYRFTGKSLGILTEEVQLPSVAECATHLQLLESFLELRQKVLKSNALDRTFSIKSVVQYETSGYGRNRRRVKKPDLTFERRRQKKWLIFVKLAVARFLRWSREIENRSPFVSAGPTSRDPVVVEKHLPRLDILMVWHCLLLNPRLYERFCKVEKCQRLHGIDIPWTAINKAISSENSSYTHPHSAVPAFLKESGIHYDLFRYLANFEQFPPGVTAALSKWGNAQLTQTDIDQALANTPDLASDLVSFLNDCKIAIDERQELLRDLGDAVLRQFTFVEKMGKHAWLRSPALDGTLSRAIDRYGKYLELFKMYPKRMFVPTADIDLVWHTHLCSPRQYHVAALSLAGRFINHDDTIGKETLEDGLETTKNFFRIRFGEEYLRCLCWDCEALRSALEKSALQGADEVDYEAISETVSLDVAYHHAVEIARRKNKPLPARPKEPAGPVIAHLDVVK